MKKIKIFMLPFFALAACAASAATVCYPQKTIRFPGGGTTEFTATDGALVGGSWWSREAGGLVFDTSEPTNLFCSGTFQNRGYVTADPIAIPGTSFAVLPNWHSATLIDATDTKNPRIVQTICFDMSEQRVTDLRLLGKLLLVQGAKRCSIYRWNDRTHRLDFVEDFLHKPTDFPARAPLDPRAKRGFSAEDSKRVRIVGNHAFLYSRERSSVRSFDVSGNRPVQLDERFLIWGLPSLAVQGDRARVFAAACGTHYLLATLDLTKSGLVDFERNAEIVKIPKGEGSSYPAMGMRSSGVVEAAGERVYADGLASGMSVEGNRVALARGKEIVVRDYARYPRFSTVVTYRQTNLLHATGVALKGNLLYVVAVPKKTAGMTFLTTPPPDHSVLLVLDVSGKQAKEIARLNVPPATACALVTDNLLYVPGIGHYGSKDNFAIVDVSTPSAPKVAARPAGLVESAAYRIRVAPEGAFYLDGPKVKRLDVTDPLAPKLVREYVTNREIAYGVDDFALANGKLYAISHASLAVFALDGAGGVPPCTDADLPVWSEQPPAGVAFRFDCEKKVALPEGECVASVVAKDGTVYVAAGYSGLAIVAPDGKVRYARHRGPRDHYNYGYATGVALSPDGKTVHLFSGKDEGCYLAYRTDALAKSFAP